jgi:hypothetical protein
MVRKVVRKRKNKQPTQRSEPRHKFKVIRYRRQKSEAKYNNWMESDGA